MEMMSIGDKVLVNTEDGIKEAVINKLYTDIDTVIVRYADGEVAKVCIDDVTALPHADEYEEIEDDIEFEELEEVEFVDDIDEDDDCITIDRDAYQEACSRVVGRHLFNRQNTVIAVKYPPEIMSLYFQLIVDIGDELFRAYD